MTEKDPAIVVVEQPRQLGTGHAVLQARPVFQQKAKALPTRYLILNGDTPLLSEGTVRNYLSEAISKCGAGNRVEAYRMARDAGWL